MKVLILYFTKTGHTLEAANATASGIRSAGSEVNLQSTKDFRATELADYDALIVGSPCWGAAINNSGVAKPITTTTANADRCKGFMPCPRRY